MRESATRRNVTSEYPSCSYIFTFVSAGFCEKEKYSATGTAAFCDNNRQRLRFRTVSSEPFSTSLADSGPRSRIAATHRLGEKSNFGRSVGENAVAGDVHPTWISDRSRQENEHWALRISSDTVRSHGPSQAAPHPQFPDHCSPHWKR